ncbi:MAG: hypothetical protein EXX96DRAFT_462248, partial [Benjaminiella poitrasii]
IFRSSLSPGRFLFDIHVVKNKYSELQTRLAVLEQYPNAYACVPLSDGPKRYLEVYVESQDIQQIQDEGLFPKSRLRDLPCKPIKDHSKVITGLTKSLQSFGNVLDLWILTDKITRHYMGLAYVVLDTSPRSDSVSFQPLSHIISWSETEVSFLETWRAMPTWCRYCHKGGHTKSSCVLSKASLICYVCHDKGHRSFECPRKAPPIIPFKK